MFFWIYFSAAIKIIIQHSENPEKILSRKLISKQYLFSYLHWRNVSVSQSLNKNALVQKILTLWQDTPYQSRAPMPENYQASYTQNGSSQALSVSCYLPQLNEFSSIWSLFFQIFLACTIYIQNDLKNDGQALRSWNSLICFRIQKKERTYCRVYENYLN